MIAIPDEKWAERPLGGVVLKPGAAATADELREFLAPQLREVVAAGALRVRRRDPEDERRQVPQDGAARAVRAGAGRSTSESRASSREVDGPFELATFPTRSQATGRCVVRVRAAGINFADVLIRRGRYPQMPELPAVLGSEIAGELEDGTRVMAITSGARRLRGARGGRPRAGRAAAGQRELRGGRVVPAHVPDGVHPADAAGAPASRARRCSCTRPRAASARRRSRSRARSARG